MDFGGEEDIRFKKVGRAGLVTLTRPKALNAVNHRMVLALSKALDAFEDDPAIERVVIEGEGRAFSAGGDILAIYEAHKAENPPFDFFADEYRLNARIAAFSKPYIALIDGIVMGGGVGVSCHGSHRVVTENAVFAMPEVGIGFFPDVGGSYLLPRLPEYFGIYLGLTGARLRGGAIASAGIASHYVKAADLPHLRDRLCQTDDMEACLAECAAAPEPHADDAARHAVARHFSLDTLNDVFASLAASKDPFASKACETMLRHSPTSLRVAFRQLRAGAMLSMDDCMRMEYRIVRRMLVGHDFYEGIRAAIIDKDGSPLWHPRDRADVSEKDIEPYFAPVAEGELVL